MKIEDGRRVAGAMSASLMTHAALFVLLIAFIASPGLNSSPESAMPVSLKYVHAAGIGGGGGGSNLPRVDPRPSPPRPAAPQPDAAAVPAPLAASLIASLTPPDVPGTITGLSAPVALAPGNPGGTGKPGAGAGEGDGPGKGKGSGGNEGGDVFGPGDNVTIPEVLYERRPTYTTGAMQKRTQGTVEIEAIAMADGSVAQPRVTRSLDPGLDQRALEAVIHWRFKPGRRRDTNQPVNVRVSIHLAFILR